MCPKLPHELGATSDIFKCVYVTIGGQLSIDNELIHVSNETLDSRKFC